MKTLQGPCPKDKPNRGKNSVQKMQVCSHIKKGQQLKNLIVLAGTVEQGWEITPFGSTDSQYSIHRVGFEIRR